MVYTLELSSGQWDDHHSWTQAVFTDEKLANDALADWIKLIKDYKNRYSISEQKKFEEVYLYDDEPTDGVNEYMEWICHPFYSYNENSFRVNKFVENENIFEERS